MIDTSQTSTLYKNLVPNENINARVTERDTGLEDLAAQIKAKGLIQPIVVRPAKGGKFEIIAGNRRYVAIGLLIKSKDWMADQHVPIMVRDEDDTEALETSLMENVARLPMHPVDQYERFAELELAGRSNADIAATFGLPERQVRQRLALGNLATEIRDAWRDGKLDADAAQAFAICPDKKLQVKAYKDFEKRRWGRINPHEVRSALINDRPGLDDPRLRFVGIDRYKAAGGKLVESLFENDGYVEDGALLKRLVKERLLEKCEELVADGWLWAEPAENYPNRWSMDRETPRTRYTPEQKARLKEIDEELRKLQSGDFDDEDETELGSALRAEKDEIEDTGRAKGFSAAVKAKTGCLISISANDFTIDYGFYKSKQKKPKPAAKKAAEGAVADEPEAPKISEALLVAITALQTQAVAEVLAEKPAIAVRAAAAALTAKSESWSAQCPVRLKAEGMVPRALGADDDDDDHDDVEGEGELGGTGFATAFESISEKEAASVLAGAMGRALDLRQIKYKRVPETDVAALIAALPGDLYLKRMRERFDATDYFLRASARIATAALEEMGHTDPLPKGKEDRVQIAADKARETGWLPLEIRCPEYALIGASPKKAKGRKAA